MVILATLVCIVFIFAFIFRAQSTNPLFVAHFLVPDMERRGITKYEDQEFLLARWNRMLARVCYITGSLSVLFLIYFLVM